MVVLNGGSSSGKSAIARRLQELLGPTWMVLGVDDLIRALPGGDHLDDRDPARRDLEGPGVLAFGHDGSVVATDAFRHAEAAWYKGLAAIGRSGTGLIVVEVFLGARASQARLAAALSGLAVAWVGVRCDRDVAAARERSRPDRVVGMAHLQAERVHEGVTYDLVVDTTATSAADCAREIASYVTAQER